MYASAVVTTLILVRCREEGWSFTNCTYAFLPWQSLTLGRKGRIYNIPIRVVMMLKVALTRNIYSNICHCSQ